MKKLLQINVSANLGSTGVIAEEIGLLAMEQNWESYIAYGRAAANSKNNLIKIGNNWDKIRHIVETRLFDNHAFSSTKQTEKLIKTIDAIQPTIVHCHNLHGYYIHIEILFHYLIKHKIPTIWTLHDCWGFTGHCTFFDSIHCMKWVDGCHHCEKKRKYPRSIFLDNSKNNFNRKKRLFTLNDNMTLVTVSNWLASHLKKSFLKDRRIVVIHNGIDVHKFKPATDSALLREKYNLNKKFVILGVANVWDERKGFEDFLELSKIIDNTHIIVLIGLNDKQIRKLPFNVAGIKRTENQMELAKIYSVADIFLNLSIQESFGLTTLESLACGTPVLVYNKTALPEIINDDVGWVTEVRDFIKILHVIEHIRNEHPQYTLDRRLKCREYAVKYFNKDEKYMNYINLYNEIDYENL